MPYIPMVERAILSEGVKPKTPGQLAYALTKMVLDYKSEHGSDYEGLATIVGVLETVKLEFVRQAINPYEDFKMQRNGGLSW